MMMHLKCYLHKRSKDFRSLQYFLGIEVTRSNRKIIFSKRKYVLDILSKTGMLECRTVDATIEANVKLLPHQEEILMILGDIAC